MTTLAQRILTQLEDRPMSVDRLAKSLGIKPSQRLELNRELTLLNRAHRIMYTRGNEWAIAAEVPAVAQVKQVTQELRSRDDAPFDTVPATVDPVVSDSLVAAAPKSRRPNGMTADIIELLGKGPLTRRGISNVVGSSDALDRALYILKRKGRVVRTDDGIWSLPSPSASADAGVDEPGPLVDETDLSAFEEAEAVTAKLLAATVLTNGVTNEGEKLNTLAAVADRFAERGKFDKPKQRKTVVEGSLNGFIVSEHRDQSVTAGEVHVFNHFADLVEFLRGEYFA